MTAVDTSVLIDVFGADARFGPASGHALRTCLNEGSVVVCDVVWSETRVAFASDEAFAQAMATLQIGYSALAEGSASAAGAICRKYRSSGGRRDRVIADFLIGAHAQKRGYRLLTMDQGIYAAAFPRLILLSV